MCTMYKMFQTSAMIAFAYISPQQYVLKIRTVHIFLCEDKHCICPDCMPSFTGTRIATSYGLAILILGCGFMRDTLL